MTPRSGRDLTGDDVKGDITPHKPFFNINNTFFYRKNNF